MDLQQLQRMGAIVPRKLFKREIEIRRPVLKPEAEWSDPEVPESTDEWETARVTAFLRLGSAADALEIANASPRERPFVAVFRAVCKENGEPLFDSLEDAMQIAPWLAFPLFNAISAISGGFRKNSQPRTSSGANSRSPSAAGRSRNGKRRSTSKKSGSGTPTETSAGP